jgi:hypothetical protein
MPMLEGDLNQVVQESSRNRYGMCFAHWAQTVVEALLYTDVILFYWFAGLLVCWFHVRTILLSKVALWMNNCLLFYWFAGSLFMWLLFGCFCLDDIYLVAGVTSYIL